MAQSRAHSGPPGEKMAKDPRAFLQLAEEHRRSGRLKEAITVCLEGLGLHPGLDAARITLGRAYLESGQPEIARDTLEEVFHRLPEHHLAGKLLAEAQQRLGDLSGAALTCRDLLRHYPRDREIEAILEAVTHPQPAAAGDAAAEAARAVAAAPAPAAAAAPAAMPTAAPSASASPPQPRRVDAAPPARPPAAPVSSSDPEPEYMPEDVGVRAGKAAPGVVTPPPVRGASRSADAARPSARDALQTSTLADLYLRQGLVDRAIEVYRAMLRVDPANERAKRRLAEIESGQTGAPPAAARSMPASQPAATPPPMVARATDAPMTPDVQRGKAVAPSDPQADARRQAIARLESWLDTVRRGSTGSGRAG